MDTTSLFALLGFIAACLAAASTGAKWGPDEWYATIAKPSWIPPNWAFAPAWTVFYTLLAISGWLVWREAGFSGAGVALALYFSHIVFNAVWSPLFFGMHRVGLALVDAGLMWVSLVATIIAFAQVDATATWLLVVYLGWVTFAFFLNLAVLRLNRDRAAEPVASRR